MKKNDVVQEYIIPETSFFIVLFKNGYTHNFTVKKVKEIFTIYWTDFIKAYGYEGNPIPPQAHSIEFTKNNFTLKGMNHEIICNLANYNQKMNPDLQQLPEIEKIYIDPALRQELLARGQLRYDEDACRIPGILYEAVNENIEINKSELFEENYDEELFAEEENIRTKLYTRSLIRR